MQTFIVIYKKSIDGLPIHDPHGDSPPSVTRAVFVKLVYNVAISVDENL